MSNTPNRPDQDFDRTFEKKPQPRKPPMEAADDIVEADADTDDVREPNKPGTVAPTPQRKDKNKNPNKNPS